MKRTYFYAGCIGGIIVVVFLLIALILLQVHNFIPVKIINSDIILAENIKKITSLQDLKETGIILTPAEYTNNLASYYNTFITLIIALLAAFSYFTYSISKKTVEEQVQEEVKKELLEMMRDSKAFETSVLGTLYGKISQEYATQESLQELRNELNTLYEKVNEGLNENTGKAIIE